MFVFIKGYKILLTIKKILLLLLPIERIKVRIENDFLYTK